VNEVRPAYGGRCFADIPGAVVRLLTGDGEGGLDPDVLGDLDRRWTRVALVLVDAFGWSCAERHAEHPFLRRVAAEGRLARLTSQFPSTTSAHMTTLHTGLPVGETGIYEWFQLEPALDRVIAPLLFSYAGDDERETLRASDLDPDTLYPATTVYERLRSRTPTSPRRRASSTPSRRSPRPCRPTARRSSSSRPITARCRSTPRRRCS
jgi:hypothetical protein